jgi:hypothetical protein
MNITKKTACCATAAAAALVIVGIAGPAMASDTSSDITSDVRDLGSILGR